MLQFGGNILITAINFIFMIQTKLYNKFTIVAVSILGTPFVGSILYSENLRALDKGGRFMPILFALIYNGVVDRILRNIFHISEIISYVPMNLIGGLILICIFWTRQIGDLEFESKPSWKPIVIIILIIAALIAIGFSFNKFFPGILN